VVWYCLDMQVPFCVVGVPRYYSHKLRPILAQRTVAAHVTNITGHVRKYRDLSNKLHAEEAMLRLRDQTEVHACPFESVGNFGCMDVMNAYEADFFESQEASLAVADKGT
jgi:hypothetical protein